MSSGIVGPGSSPYPILYASTLDNTGVIAGQYTNATGLIGQDGRWYSVQNGASAQNSLGVFLPAGWGKFWKAARDTAKSQNATIWVIGDSITQGFYSSNLQTNGYVSVLRTALQSMFGTGGTGFVSVANNPLLAPAGAASAYTNTAMGVQIVGGWNTTSVGGPCNFCAYTNTSGNSLTFINMNGSHVTVYYTIGPTSGTFTIVVNGSNSVTINASSGSTSFGSQTFTGFPAGTNYSVIITCTSASDAVFTQIYGVSATFSSGVIVNNGGLSGQTSGSLTTYASGPVANPFDCMGGQLSPANLVIWAIGVNDAHALSGAAASPQAFSLAFLQAVQQIREYGGSFNGLGTVDILCVFPPIGQWQSSGPNYYQMMSQVFDLCVAYNIGFVSLGNFFSNSWLAGVNALYYGDGTPSGLPGNNEVHPGDVGHKFIASVVTALLSQASYT